MLFGWYDDTVWPFNGLVKGLSSIFFPMGKVWGLMWGQANGNFSVDYDLRYWGEY